MIQNFINLKRQGPLPQMPSRGTASGAALTLGARAAKGVITLGHVRQKY